jgi:hypothetical protein
MTWRVNQLTLPSWERDLPAWRLPLNWLHMMPALSYSMKPRFPEAVCQARYIHCRVALMGLRGSGQTALSGLLI